MNIKMNIEIKFLYINNNYFCKFYKFKLKLF